MNARDRIGKGPWVNVKGQSVARDLEHLHGDTLDLARMGNTLTRATALNEKGEQVPGLPFPGAPAPAPANIHDILTGSQLDGRAFTDTADHTCNNWTSEDAGSAQVGTTIAPAGRGPPGTPCTPARDAASRRLSATGGAGLLYRFATGETK